MSEVTVEPVGRARSFSYESPSPKQAGRIAFWIGWVVSVLVALMLGMGGVMDVMKPPFVVEGTARAGFHEENLVPLGLVIIASALLFLIPRTAMFGAILLTAYLGGAVTVHTQLREYPQIAAPVLVATVMWVAFVLRDRRVRAAVFG